MLRTHIYLPEKLAAEIENTARASRKSKAEVIREALKHGLNAMRPLHSQSALKLVKLAELAQKLTSIGPKDLSEKHDKYGWEGDENDSV